MRTKEAQRGMRPGGDGLEEGLMATGWPDPINYRWARECPQKARTRMEKRSGRRSAL